jgi:N-acetylglutamate synthase-like GNAT family acetyltransferase
MAIDHVITEASEADAELLASLIRDSFADVAKRFGLTPENCPTHPSNCAPEWIQAAFAKGVEYYLLRTSDRPAGCVALERVSDDVCYLERLAVLPSFRRNGLGETLVSHVVARAEELGLRAIEIGTIAAQTELRQWYERQGFEVTRVASFERLPFDVAFMRKTLVEETATPSKESDRQIEGDIRACGG